MENKYRSIAPESLNRIPNRSEDSGTSDDLIGEERCFLPDSFASNPIEHL